MRTGRGDRMDARILVVDDSAFMRKIISDKIASVEGLVVIATARNGEDAVKKAEELRPDAITLDVNMPKMNGIEAVKQIRRNSTVPIFMLSSLADQQTTMEALEAGATDFIQKPLDLRDNSEKFQKELATTILPVLKKQQQESASVVSSSLQHLDRKMKAAVIGASTGGPGVVMQLIRTLPDNLSFPIFVVQHMPEGFTASFAARLDDNAKVVVREARDQERIVPGRVYIAPGNYHMLVRDGLIHLVKTPKLHGVRPAVDILFESAAEEYGADLLAVILTGMGKDGTQGMRKIKEKGGSTIAQDEASSVVYGMPGNALKAGVVDICVDIPDICRLLREGMGRLR